MSSNPRALAQDAAGWYMSNLDPHSSNESNIHRYLRTPVVALTVKAFLPEKPNLPPTVAAEVAAANGTAHTKQTGNGKEHEEEEKKCTVGGDWRDYLVEENSTNEAIRNNERKLLKEKYNLLSRRTRARIEAFLAGCSLAVPGPEEEESNPSHHRINEGGEGAMVSLQDGLSGFGIDSPPIPKSTPPHRAPSLTQKMGRSIIGQIPDPNRMNHPQIAQNDLMLRLELYIRTVQRVRNLNEECVIAMEPPKAIRARGRYITDAFVATASHVRNITPVLSRLLHCLTMEMLAVECVAEEITKVIRRVAAEYEHGTSFASLAFLSTPETNADSLLTPLILKYLKYLQADWERLVRECELERMLARATDPNMRKMFKTIEFHSIGHLLEVCHEYRGKLQNIELPPNLCAVAENINTLCNNNDAVRQALRDLRREKITVNGHVLPPVTSRKELISLLTQTLNSRTLTSAQPKKKRNARKKKPSRPPAKIPTDQNESEFSSDYASSPEKQRRPGEVATTPMGAASISDVSGLESADYDSSSAFESSPENLNRKLPPSNGATRKRRSTFHLSTVDMLTRRLLIAASRTGNGGDAYFFV